MHQTNPTEVFRQHQLAPLRDAEESEKVERSEGHPEAVAFLERPEEESWVQILLSTGPVP